MKQKHTKYTQTHTNKSTHSEMGPVWQNPIQRTVRTAHLSVLMLIIQRKRWNYTVSVWNVDPKISRYNLAKMHRFDWKFRCANFDTNQQEQIRTYYYYYRHNV